MFSITASISSGYASVYSSLTVSMRGFARLTPSQALDFDRMIVLVCPITFANRANRKEWCSSFAAQRAEFARSFWSSGQTRRRRPLPPPLSAVNAS